MSTSLIRAVLEECWKDKLPGEDGMVIAICELSAPPGISKEELIAKAAAVSLGHRASDPGEEDEFWLGQSPFDGRWYEFATSTSAGWPSSPTRIYDSCPW